jgi:hypothetical protein
MVPGTACTAIGRVLKERFGGRMIPERSIFRDGRKIIGAKHCSVQQLLDHEILSASESSNLVKFPNVRNPFDRFATEYARSSGSWLEKHLNDPNSHVNNGPPEFVEKERERVARRISRARDMDFETWLFQRLDWHPLNNPIEIAKRYRRRFLEDRREILFPLTRGVDEIIHFERLEEDFNKVLRAAGMTEYVPIPHINATPTKNDYRRYYTDTARDRIEAYFGKELSEFQYTF